MINFFAATEKHAGADQLAQFRTQLDFLTKTSWTSNGQISIRGVNKIGSKHWEPLKKKCDYIFKRSESISKERKCIPVQDWLGPEGQKIYDWFKRVQTMYYDYKLMSGTKLERVVSPECNENVASKRNLKNGCKKPGEKTPAETAIM